MIFTIGHSNLLLSEFTSLLAKNQIGVLCDVRTVPSSRYSPHFNGSNLKSALSNSGIRYEYFGNLLGGRPSEATCYVNGRVDYELVSKTLSFQYGLQNLIALSRTGKVAIMCTEKDPINCHRTLLVARNLAKQGLSISHILGNGQLETHEDLENRLFSVSRLPNADLFQDHEQLLNRAYRIQSEKVSYVSDGD